LGLEAKEALVQFSGVMIITPETRSLLQKQDFMKNIPLHGLFRKLLQTENQVVGLGLHQSSENVNTHDLCFC
jgi:hypothetical protein